MISEYLGFDSDYIILGLAAFCVILFFISFPSLFYIFYKFMFIIKEW